jgi:hypothetical protein
MGLHSGKYTYVHSECISMLETFWTHKYRITPRNSSRNRFQFGSHRTPDVSVWRFCHLLHVARTTTAIFCQRIRSLNSTKNQMAHTNAEVKWERVMNLDTRWKWEISYMLRALGTWFPRTAHLFHLVYSRHSASAFSLGISHSRKRFETKCLAVHNCCVTFDCSFIWSSGRRRTKINSSHYKLMLVRF